MCSLSYRFVLYVFVQDFQSVSLRFRRIHPSELACVFVCRQRSLTHVDSVVLFVWFFFFVLLLFLFAFFYTWWWWIDLYTFTLSCVLSFLESWTPSPPRPPSPSQPQTSFEQLSRNLIYDHFQIYSLMCSFDWFLNEIFKIVVFVSVCVCLRRRRYLLIMVLHHIHTEMSDDRTRRLPRESIADEFLAHGHF